MAHTPYGSSGFRRERSPRSFNVNYFIAFEGWSEKQYMDGIKAIAELDRRNRNLTLQILPREVQNRDMSDPMFNLERLRDYVHALDNNDEVTPFIAVASIIQRMYDMIDPSVRWRIVGRLNAIQDMLIIALNESECVYDGYISDKDKAIEIVKMGLASEDVLRDYLDEAKFPDFDTPYDRQIDRLCLIVDRDYSTPSDLENVSEEQRKKIPPRDRKYYWNLLKECKDEHDDLKYVKLYVSNPCFEFWLMEHFEETINMMPDEEDELKYNPKDRGKNSRASFKRIDKLIFDHYGDHYAKSKINFNKWFAGRLNIAVENGNSFATDLQNLENNIGSNLGKLLIELNVVD